MICPTLYVHPASPNCQAVLLAAIHSDVEFRTKQVDLFVGEQSTEAFAELNPNRMVPVLRQGDFVLWEANAIAQYLAGLAGDDSLWPADERARADIARWQFWSTAHWTPALQPFVYENLFKSMKGLGSPDAALLQRAKERLDRFAGVLDRHLAMNVWLSGAAPTLADVFASSYLVYANAAQIPLQGYPDIRRWYGDFTNLPAWRALERQFPSSLAARRVGD